MSGFDKILELNESPVTERYNGQPLKGLKSIVKVFAPSGESAFLTNSSLQLDTDGLTVGIKVESTHQNETTIDPSGKWFNSNKINGVVLPGLFNERHGMKCGMGTLCTVHYKGKIAHAVVFDIGPKAKYGEGSIALHRALGFERVKNGKIVDVGIDSGVEILIYIGTDIGARPFVQKNVDDACAPLWAKFNA